MTGGGEVVLEDEGMVPYLVSGEQLVPVLAAELALAVVLCVDGPRPEFDMIWVRPHGLHVVDVVDPQLPQCRPHTYVL